MTAEEQIKLLQEQVEKLKQELASVAESKDAVIQSKEEEIQSKDAELQSSKKHIETLDGKVVTLDNKVRSLENELYWLRKKVFGKMSEKNLPLDPNVLWPTLFDDLMTDEEKQQLKEEIAKEEEYKKKLIEVKSFQRKVRKPVNLDNLEVKEEHVYPEGINFDEYKELDPEVTQTLVYVPSQIYVRKVVRHKFVLKSKYQVENPNRKPFEIAPVIQQPLPKCMASASLLTDIIINKYFYHLPFYRVIQKYKELGVVISSSTINDWFNATCERLRPIYDRLRIEVMSKDYIQVDESTLPVIDNEHHRARKGYIWCVRDVMGHLVFFHYDLGSRSQDVARKLLFGYKGAIQTDGHPLYDQFTKNGNIIALGCWAHARRYWANALTEDKVKATEALTYINKLYHIENEAKELNLSYDEIKAKRQKESYPIICSFEKWMLDTAHKVLPGSLILKAIKYTYPLLPRLSQYVNDGRYCIDNNLVENAIRPLAISRKNFLFCGNHDAAIRASIIFSLVGSCKALGINPRDWMEDVLDRISEYDNGQKDIAELLPNKWQEARLATK